MKGMPNWIFLQKAIFAVSFVQILKFQTESTLQLADYACQMSHVFNNSLSETIHVWHALH
jgi:hypothetical protein